MKLPRIAQAMNYIDDELITSDLITSDLTTNDLTTNDLITSDLITNDLTDHAENKKRTVNKMPWLRKALLVACVAVVITVGVLSMAMFNEGMFNGGHDPIENIDAPKETESSEDSGPIDQIKDTDTTKETENSENSDLIMPIGRPENDYVRFNGELVDLANVTVDEITNYDRAALDTLERLDGLYGEPSSDSYILKITVIDYPESARILYDSGISLPCTSVPCRIDSIIYKGEGVDLHEGQNIDMTADYSFDEKEGEIQLHIEPGAQVLRKGYSYIAYGSYAQPSSGDIYYVNNYAGCFEISSDAEKNAFAQSLGLNYSPINPVQYDVFEKYAYVLTPSELAMVKKDNTVAE